MTNDDVTLEYQRPKSPFKKTLLVSLVIIGATLIVLGFLKKNQSDSSSGGSFFIQVGEKLPEFKWANTKNEFEESQKALEGKKILLINFWASWCGPCIDEMPSLVKLYQTYVDQGLQIVGVNVDEDPLVAIEKIHQKFQIPFESKVDKEGELSQKFKAYSLPTTVIIDYNRRILYADSGDENWMSPSMIKQVETWLK